MPRKGTGGVFVSLGVATAILATLGTAVPVLAQAPGGSLDPTMIPKYQSPLIIPPAMPRSDRLNRPGDKNLDYYEIAVRQFDQQILPPGLPMTTVWSYGSVQFPGTVAQGGSFNYPAFTVEAKWQRPTRVKWVNDLVADPVACAATTDFANDPACASLPHLLPVDQTLHWANPPQDCMMGGPRTDCMGTSAESYTGPVPIVTHVHGADTYEWSDGYPEAWFLPAANDIPAGYASAGSYFERFKAASEAATGQAWEPGTAVFEYPNDMRATTLWYHDHSLGMTRTNVYAGPAGFWLLRGGPGDMVLDARGRPATLPGPAPALGDPPGMTYFEIPIVIQDRSFNQDGSLFYPDNRAFFEGVSVDQLQIPFIPDPASDIAPIWNPEFFGNTMVVNGRTWPYLDVQQRRYRLRFLNGCQSRFLILRFDHPGVKVWQIGADGGFLPAPLDVVATSGGDILLGPAERADVIVDFGGVPGGTPVNLVNIGPDEPYGGGTPGLDFAVSDPLTTGNVMRFNVFQTSGKDRTTPPSELLLPAAAPVGPAVAIRRLSLNEEESSMVFVSEDAQGNIVVDPNGEAFAPKAALLGTLNPDGSGNGLLWSDAITEDPMSGDVEIWELHNLTMDAHPIHIHLVQFQVLEREDASGAIRGPEPWETGFKDTVIAYPDEITRVTARFDRAGLYVWHCHILEHEDNEMMRPYCVANADGSLPASCAAHGVAGH